MSKQLHKRLKNWASGRLRTFLHAAFYAFPFILGFIGFLPMHNYHISSAAYSAARLYMLSVDGYELTVWIDIARWWAFVVMVKIVLRVLSVAATETVNFLKVLFVPGSCAVYGDSLNAGHLLDDLGWQGVAASGLIVRSADNHVLLFDSDEKNLDFYAKHYKALKSKPTYIMLNKAIPYCLQGNNLHIFNMSECRAREYWKKKSHRPKVNDKIGIIGFGSLGQEILTAGLLLNIFSANSGVEYHVWGKSEGFCGLHPMLMKKFGERSKHGKAENDNAPLHPEVGDDKVIFHDEEWKCGLLSEEKRKNLDRLIFCMSPAQNLLALTQTMTLAGCKTLHVYLDNKEQVLAFPKEGSKIACFGSPDELFTRDVVLKESRLESAKKLHARYREKYSSLSDWDNLSAFHKHSNTSAADYREVLWCLKKENPEINLAELEHIRWCRFHYLNNWSYADEKNVDKKEHNLLVPFSVLSEVDKQKCEENVKMLLEDETP